MITKTAPAAFQVDAADNVASLLNDAEEGSTLTVLGPAGKTEMVSCEKIGLGHKIALTQIGEGKPITKFGVIIGIAVRRIEAGEWVHLHNCRSQLDERSGSFDVQTGEPGDNAYA